MEILEIVVLSLVIILVGILLIVLGLVEKESLAIGLGIVFILLGISSIPVISINNYSDNYTHLKATSQNEIIPQVEYKEYLRDDEDEMLHKVLT